MTILDSCRELLEICRVKCGPSDEPILPGGRTNEQAMRDAMTAIEQFVDLVRALDEADTAFAVINICDGLTPQARGCIRSAWPLVRQELAKIKGPDSAFAHVAAAVRQFPTGYIRRETITEHLNAELGRDEFVDDDSRLTDALCSEYALDLGEMLSVDLQDAEDEGVIEFHRSWLQRLGVAGDQPGDEK